MLDIVRSGAELEPFRSTFGVTYLVCQGDGLMLESGTVTLFDGRATNPKRLESELTKRSPDVLFGCEWTAAKDHMDYPKHAMRIQTARAIRDASCVYAFTPSVLADRKTFEVARFNARVLSQAKVPVAFVSLARDAAGLATPRDLDAIGSILGFSDEDIARGRNTLERVPEVRFERAFSVELPR